MAKKGTPEPDDFGDQGSWDVPSPDAPQEAGVLRFKATVSRDGRGRFAARSEEFPGMTGEGDTSQEAQSSLERAIQTHLASTASLALEPVYEEPVGFVPYAAVSFQERIFIATNLDVILTSETGKRESWRRTPVTQQPSEYFQVFEGEQPEEILEPGEYLTQVYSLATFTGRDGGRAVYAGTNLKGLVYYSASGDEWTPAFSTGEERVHSLMEFRGVLYAGTSSKGRIYRWDGVRVEIVHQLQEMGITAMAVFRNTLYAGTYPEGFILRSEDGEVWEIAGRTGTKLVNSLCATRDSIYAACSSPAGGSIFRSTDGENWEKCFASDKDLNIYSLAFYSGSVYAGTGEAGKLYSSRDGKRWEACLVSPEAAIRALHVHKGRLFLCCERRGMIYRTTLTESPAPRISDVKVSSLDSSRAVLEWATDVPCEASVQFGVGHVRDQTVGNATLSRKHRFILDGLQAGIRYTYLLTARNAEGGQSVHLGDEGFVTLVLPSLRISSTTHPEEDQWYASRDVSLLWEPVKGASCYLVQVSNSRISRLDINDTRVQEPAFSSSVSADGVWWFAAAAVDETGNVGDMSVRRIRVDTSAPVPSVSSISHPDPDSWYASPVVEIAAKGEDGLSGVGGFSYAIGRMGESWDHLSFQEAPGSKWSLPRLPDGVWEIFVKMRDGAGNESKPTSLRVRVDSAPPAISIELSPMMVKAGELDIKWNAGDERSGISRIVLQQRREGGQWETVYEGTAGETKVYGLDGWKVWYRVLARDGAGNQASDEISEPVTFDGAPPDPVTSLETKSLAGGDILLKWAPSSDVLSEVVRYHVYRSIDEEQIGLKVGTVDGRTQEYLDDGMGLASGARYGYRVFPEDAVGNVQREGVACWGNCDKEAASPKLKSRTHPPEEWTDKTDAVIEWEAPTDSSGISEYLWRVDRSPVSSLARGVDESIAGSPLKLQRLLDGIWYVHVSAVDGAGNVSPPAHYPLRIVTKPPHARLKPLAGMVNTKRIRLSWEKDEGVVAVSIGVREGGSQEWRVLAERLEGNNGEVEVEREGLFEFSVRALDSYGRWGVWEEGQVTLVDVTPPLEVPLVEARPLPNGAVRLEWDASWDELSGMASYKVMRSRKREDPGELLGEVAAIDECALLDNCEAIAEGTRLFYRVWPADSAGNVLESSPVVEALCDRTAPRPRLVSSTHPDPGRSYPSRHLEVLWDAEDDLTGVIGVGVELDAIANTVPKTETLPLRSDRTISFELPRDGRWYLHARAVDGAGNASETAHLGVSVDTHCDPPVVSFAQDPFLEWQQTGAVTVLLKAPEDFSGITGSWYLVNQAGGAAVDKESWTRHTTEVLKVKPSEEGVWYIHVAAEDAAGNLSEPVSLMMRLSTGLPMTRVLKSSHPEGMWCPEKELSIEWELVEGERVSYLYWMDASRMETPPMTAHRVAEPRCSFRVEEGNWYMHICAVDEHGRKSQPVVYLVRVDRTPPVVAVSSASHPRGEWSSRSRVQYVIEAEDIHSGTVRIELTLTPGGEKPEIWELALGNEGERDIPTEGMWTLWARAFDQAGNESPHASWDILVDLDASVPDVSSYTHPEGQWSSSRDVELVLQSGEDLSGVAEYYAAFIQLGEDVPDEPPPDAETLREETVLLQVPGEGKWVLAVWAKDMAGNMSLPARYVVAVDESALPPSGFVVEPTGEGGWIRSREVQVFWKAPEEISGDPAGYVYCVDRSPLTVPEQETGGFTALPDLEIGELEDGNWYLHVRTLDAAGNLSDETAHLKLAVDAEAPTLEIRCPDSEEGEWLRKRQVTIQVHGADEISGFRGCFWTMHEEGAPVPDIMQGRWKEEVEWGVEIPNDGVWVIAAVAMDGAGNLSEPRQVLVRVDSHASPPKNIRSLTHPDPGKWHSNSDVALDWDEAGEGSGVRSYVYQVARNAETIGPIDKWQRSDRRPISVHIPEDGRWIIAVAVEDMVGNISEPAFFTAQVDTVIVSPQITVLSHPNPALWYPDTAVEAEISSEDTLSGVKEVLVGMTQKDRIDPSEMKPLKGRRYFNNVGPGVWHLFAITVDNAGNRSEPSLERVMIEPEALAPLVVCESHPAPDHWYSNAEIRFTIMPPARTSPRQFWMIFDQNKNTQPTKATAHSTNAGHLKLEAKSSGVWYLHVVAESRRAGLATQAAHVKVMINMEAPPAVTARSATHFMAPRKSALREAVFEWDEPADLSGIRGYSYSFSRQGMLGFSKDKAGFTSERRLEIKGLDLGSYELVLSAVNNANLSSTPVKYPVLIADSVDLLVVVKSESWRVMLPGVDVDLRRGDKSIKRGRTSATGDCTFKDIPYGVYTVVVGIEKAQVPLVFENVSLEEGEAAFVFEVTMAGCAWTICGNNLRLWVPDMWVSGGRVEMLNEREARVAEAPISELAKRESFFEMPLPEGLLKGYFQLMGGMLSRLKWPPIGFFRLP